MKNFKLLFVLFITLLVACDKEENNLPNPEVENSVPTATEVTATLESDKLTGTYRYSDKENDEEGTSKFQWYRADDENGTNAKKIVNATEKTYHFTSNDNDKYLAFEVLPIQKDGKKGVAVKSKFVGKIVFDSNSNNEPVSKFEITSYIVSGKNITKEKDFNVQAPELKAYQKATDKHKELWNQVLKVIPENYLSKINNFVIFAGNFDSDSDMFGTMGYVSYYTSLEKCELGLAIDIAYNTNFDDPNEGLHGTIVHEFGHLVTLNNEQINPDKNNCQTSKIDEGCMRDNSFLYNFYTNYWKDLPANQDGSQRYSENPDNYVSDYAATNIVEDYAETFRYYILGNIPTAGTLVKEQKIRKLDTHQSMQTLRTFIRGHIGNSSLYARKRTYKLGNFRGCGTHKMMMKKHQNRQ